MHRRLLLVAVLAGSALVGAACGSDMADTAPAGRRTYLQQCSACHGPARQGIASSPALSVARMQELGDAQIRLVIQNGKGKMTGFGDKIRGAELDALVTYLLQG